MKDIAIFSYVCPFSKKTSGGSIDSQEIIKSLKYFNGNIDTYAVKKLDEELKENEIKENINNFYHVNSQKKVVNLLGTLPYTVNSRYYDELARIAENKKEYDLAIYEAEHMFKYRLNKNIKSKVNYLRMVNIESIYSYQMFKSAFPGKISTIQFFESLKYKAMENRINNYFDKLLFISIKERDIFIKWFPKYKDKFVWLPPIAECVDEINYSNYEKNNILFFGDIEVSHNYEGIKWFLQHIWPDIKQKYADVELNIIGNISERNKINLRRISTDVNILGFVEDLNYYIDRATFIITPILHGAGVKIKVIHALGKGKIVIGTDTAIEGTDLVNNKHLLVGNSKEEYLDLCIKVLESPENYFYLAENSISHIRSVYSNHNQFKIINDLFIEDCKKYSRTFKE